MDDLTFDDLYCISRHTRYLVEAIYQEKEGIKNACFACPRNKTCDLNFMLTLGKLGSVTGVGISYVKN